MRPFPLAAIIAVPLIAAFVIFVLLPRMNSEEKKKPRRFSLNRR
jgi:hypothetical protein